ncbi:hypothetical protein B8X02_17650 [Stenotrophomonas rhizophila]|uniref:hypothetical protein n=1 Tax=Stenotrophomonas rhizophila TaxID=216778 RepID=UPI000BA5C474|nr:hypothetical protein [Stenotrophomonas rhizophila]PAK89412.1 hypothetical protein B8X02_17650 [Stenotrophomonas rhizophila]
MDFFTPAQLNLTGLVLNFVGTLVFALWGALGWKVHRDGRVSSQGIEMDHPNRKRAVFWLWFKFNVLSRGGLALIAVGFLLQFVAALI